MENTALGIEFGSTRIKAVLAGPGGEVLATGSYGWENRLLPGGVWTYSLEEAAKGMQAAYAALKEDYGARTGKTLSRIGAIGVSGMMHGYLPLGADGAQLAPFRTWRCTITGRASAELSREFDFAVPQRWSVAHLYQRILDGGEEVPRIARLTTLAGWVHRQLTGVDAMGLGEASGMFPVDPATQSYDAKMVAAFERLAAARGCAVKVADVFPRPLPAGREAGRLTAAG
ncbi:MAG: ATPase, partial [Kiritimatiellae bacterium]|nr:ATPase [Kiritimatiellia bacterium]